MAAAACAFGQSEWQSSPSPTTQDLWGIAYGSGNGFVAVGTSGTILYSSDSFGAPAWNIQTSPTTAWLTSVAYGNEQFVAVGDVGVILKSGPILQNNWTAEVSGVTQRLDGIAFANGMFLAAGEGGTVVTSTDGVSWKVQQSGVTTWLRGIAYGNKLWVVTGQGGVILTSPDGVTFTARQSGTTQNLEAVMYDGSKFVAVGQGFSEVISTDGVAWTVPVTNSPISTAALDFRGLANLGVDVAAGDNGVVLDFSSSGILIPLWLQAPPTGGWRGLAAGHATLVAVGAGGAVAYSTQDGVEPVSAESISVSTAAGPLGAQAPYVGSTVTLTANISTSSAYPCTYQWTFNGTVVGTGPTLTLDNLTPAQAGDYAVSVSNPADTSTAGLSLNVDPNPASINLVDTTFSPPKFTYPVITAKALPDGRIYVATGQDSVEVFSGTLYRLLPSGAPDPTFTPVDGYWNDIEPQLDGRVILTFFFPLNPRTERVNADGSLDETFVPDAWILGGATCPPVPLSDGRALGFPNGAVQRYLSSGALDPSYTPQFVTTWGENVRAVSGLDPSGRIYIAGDSHVVRLNPDGTLDPSFAAFTLQGSPFDAVQAMMPTAAGVTIFSNYTTFTKAWSFTTYMVEKALADGTPDPSFTNASSRYFEPQPSIVLGFAPDGSAYATSYDAVTLATNYLRYGLVRLDAEGNMDRNVWAELGQNVTEISAVLPLPSGKVLVIGSFTSLNGVQCQGIARLNPDTTAYANRLSNLSTRAYAGQADSTLIAGFVTQNGTKSLLLRGIGPTLASFGVAGSSVLADPTITLVSGSQTAASNDNWGSNANASAIIAASSKLGAFSLPTGSLDSALLVPVTAGSSTLQVNGVASDTGIALAEIYDADPAPTSLASPRLINISTRSVAGSGDKTLTVGFVIAGSDTRRVLVRAVGPALSEFGIASPLPDPLLKVYQGSTVIAVGATDQSEPYSYVGAFSAGLGDSYCVLSLAPGAYTAQVTSPSNASGVALVEVYEFP